MISSEVQRTLVKSPPELWAEISDPAALARHLGEFGEVRITRVQPEQKVEWEAPEASGSIVIKPSGWGTKVKLTVTRELSEAEADGAPNRAPEGSEEPATADRPVEEGPAIDEGASPVEAHEAEGEAVAGAEAEAGSVATEPVVAAQPIAALVKVDEPTATELGYAGEGLQDELESGRLAEPAEDRESQPKPEPERRRGFFARLFGRRRVARSGEADRIDAQAVPIAPLDDFDHAPDAQLEDDGYGHEPDSGAPEIVDEEASSEALAPGEEAAIEAEADLELELAATPVTDGASGATDDPQTDGPQTDDASEHRSPTESAATLAAELEQAEEAAAKQVTAVLTGVLDTLGAAHHRPFSRA